jgi:hypothetical protein
MAITCTLKDDTPTTTIAFKSFTVISRKVTAQYFTPFAYPDGEGVEIVFVGAYFRVFRIEFTLADIPAGATAADQRATFETLILGGGDNEWKYTLTFPSEDSPPGGAEVLETYEGYVRNYDIKSISGKDIKTIKGSFEFWESTI